TVEGRLEEVGIAWKPVASVCVVMASGGYPSAFVPGKLISGLKDAATTPGAVVFQSGTKAAGGKYYTCSGRVLGVTGVGATLDQARQTAYRAVERIQFEGAHYRTDIAVAPVSTFANAANRQ
ncbi:MAG TPA: phosphoribosylglycinamide synthetase C domain-containing protein, partial [Candidatus Acidoferrales bacterium]